MATPLPQLEQAYTYVKSALRALCEREYPHPDVVLWCLSRVDLVVYLSVTVRWHVQSTPILTCLVGLGALVETSLLHVHNHPGWHGVLQ